MRIKKKTVFWIMILLILFILIGTVIRGYKVIDNTWNNPSTWTTEERIILPKVADDLKVLYEVYETDDVMINTFEFKAEYCYLYEITPSDDGTASTLKCSLLPMYYIEKATRDGELLTSQEDIKIKVFDEDPIPQDFLGRQDRSFESISSLGSTPFPVSVQLEGKYIIPESTLINKLEHYQLVSKGGEEPLTVEISYYSVSKLDINNERRVHEYAQNWKDSIDKEFTSFTENAIITQKGVAKDLLNYFAEVFTFQRSLCTKLSYCLLDYDGNPAENFFYFLFWLDSKETHAVELNKIKEAMREGLYPFSSKVPPATANADWSYITAYQYPLCPIKEIGKDRHTLTTKLFIEFMDGDSVEIEDDINYLIQEDMKSISEGYMAEGLIDMNYVASFNSVCAAYLAGRKSEKFSHDRLESIFFEIYSFSLGHEVDGTTDSLERAIYSSVAFSPYKSLYLSDYLVADFREIYHDPASEAQKDYIEWKSMINTYIMMYLYE